jgi:hypothetical protein
MLAPAAADIRRVISRALVVTSFVCCALVAISFTMFARDQATGAAQRQQYEVASGAPAAPRRRALKPVPQPRKFIDDAANSLTSPFQSIVQSSNPWVIRGVPAILALLVYGIGLRFLARWSLEWA